MASRAVLRHDLVPGPPGYDRPEEHLRREFQLVLMSLFVLLQL